MAKAERTAASKVSPERAAAESSNSEPLASLASGPAAEEQIRMRAYELYRERGGRVGDDMADWLRAEREYLERAQKPAAAPAGGGVSTPALESRV